MPPKTTTRNQRNAGSSSSNNPSAGRGKFRGVPSTSIGGRDEIKVARQKVGSGHGVGEKALLKAGGNRPKSGASKSGTSAEGGTLGLGEDNEMLRQIRDKLCEACEGIKTRTLSKAKASMTSNDYLKEIDTYADILMKHLDQKSDESIKSREKNGRQHDKDDKTTQEVKQTIEKINGWLSKLNKQIEEDKFDLKDFQDLQSYKGKVDDKKSRKHIEDICQKLKNRQEERINDAKTEKRKWNTAIEQLENEIKTDKRNENATKKDVQNDIISRIGNCTECVKKEKEAALSQAKTIHATLSTWRPKLSEGKRAQLRESKPSNVSKGVDILAILKEISVLQSEVFQVKNDEDSESSKNLREIEEQIRKMWGKVMKENAPPGIPAALLTLEKFSTENKAKLEKLLESKDRYEKELGRLHDDLKRFDGVVTDDAVKIDEKGDNVIQAIRLVRKELNEKIKDIKEDLQKGASDKKEFWSKLHQSVTKLWKTALNDDEKVTSDVRDNIEEEKVLQMIETVTTQFDKLEKVAFKLEETCYGIYEKVYGAKPAAEDHKTSTNNLKTTLRKLEETKAEIDGFADTLEQLRKILQIQQKKKSISRTCQLMVETIERFRKEYKELKQKLDDSNERERITNTEKEDLLRRLSKVASANLTDNNPNIADLSDQNRPTKLAEQFSELYDNPWTDGFEELKRLDDQKRIAFLWKIVVGTYICCKEISINHQKVLMRALQLPTDCMGEVEKTKAKKNATDLKLSPVQSKALTELKKQTVDLSVEDVMRYLTTKHKEWFKTKNVCAYASECIKLCWLMNVQSPPVYMVTDAKAGSKFDTDQYRPYTKTGKKTDFLVWPVLLLHEGGPLLCKGVAQGK